MYVNIDYIIYYIVFINILSLPTVYSDSFSTID